MVHYGIAAEVAWPAALRLLFAERQETARLRELLSGEPKVRQMTYTPEDGVEVQIEHWAVKLLAASALDILKGSGAENFVTFTLGGHPEGPVEVTVRPCLGGKKTPAQLLDELRGTIAEQSQEIERLKGALRSVADGSDPEKCWSSDDMYHALEKVQSIAQGTVTSLEDASKALYATLHPHGPSSKPFWLVSLGVGADEIHLYVDGEREASWALRGVLTDGCFRGWPVKITHTGQMRLCSEEKSDE
jgi:hypothetical protein